VGHLLRLAKSSDAPICAAIVNSWIDNTKWMPRIHSPDLITQMIKDGIPIREFWVIGDPVLGYLSFNVEAQQIMGLYVARPGIGLGRALLEQVKLGKSYIKLWSHSANTAAHRFYLREGFKISGEEKIGGDGIKEI
jgi:putative acetyltransferase